MKKVLLNAYRLAYLAPLALASQVHAQSVSLGVPENFAGFSSRDVRETISNIVRIIVGFLGLITVLIILAGGFKWMTSGGNEEKIADAKKLISAGVVGLVVILAAYAIANFVINSLQQAV